MDKHLRQSLTKEFTFVTSRSSGKGGQHVNKTESRVELVFNIHESLSLDEQQKKLFEARWPNRINEAGEFRISSGADRSQARNKQLVIARFFEMLDKAFEVPKKRIATSLPTAVKNQILDSKRKHSEVKSGRRMRTRDFL